MVKHDPQGAFCVFFVSEGLVDLRDVAVLVCERDPAHPHANVALDEGR